MLQPRLRLDGEDVPTATIAGSLVTEQIVLAIALVMIMLLHAVRERAEALRRHLPGVRRLVIVVMLAVLGLEAFSRRPAGA